MAVQIQLRRDSAANWTSTDPTLAEGEIGIELDTDKFKIGDGVTAWTSLAYVAVAALPHATSHEPGGSDTMAVDAVAGTGSLRTLGTGAQQACAGNDSRLSDARTPTSHDTSHENGGGDEISIAGLSGEAADPQPPKTHASSHQNGGSDEIATATPAANAIPKAGAGGDLDGGWIAYGSSAATACEGNDSRLSDARTPTSHASTHEPGGGDAMAVDAVAGTGSLRTLGTGAQQSCAGNDSRLSDARTPTSHASSHQHGGSDEVATATPGANAIPKADGTGALAAGWIPDGSDATAIHDNVSAEISALTEKTTPVSADLVVIEDSAASYAKKKVQVGNLPGGGGGGENEPIEYSFARALWDITTAGYAVMARFKFLGTTALGEDPTSIKLIAYQTSYSADYRIYDLTNSNVICELTGTTNTSPAILNLGTLSNLPTGEAIWELQAAEDGPGKIYLDSLHIEF